MPGRQGRGAGGGVGRGGKGQTAAVRVVTVDEILDECLVAYGSGTGGLGTHYLAVAALKRFFRPKFERALRNDDVRWTDKDEAHILERLFVLRCCQAIGRLAAQKATARGALAISENDANAARADVVAANQGGAPGDWCN
jgi:hypothetical protein